MKNEHKYAVVINHEEQYSIWRADQQLPPGWKPTRFIGSKDACFDYIEEVWTDMRPKLSREQIEKLAYRR